MATVRVKLDSPEVRALLGRLRRFFTPAKLQELFGSIGKALEIESRRSFEQEASPEGVAWRPLAASTLAEKARSGFGNQAILSRRGFLRESVIGGAQGNVIFVGSQMPYAPAHQFGARIPAREIVPRAARALRFFNAAGQPVFARRVRHPGAQIPARPFLPQPDTAARLTVDELEAALEDATQEGGSAGRRSPATGR